MPTLLLLYYIMVKQCLKEKKIHVLLILFFVVGQARLSTFKTKSFEFGLAGPLWALYLSRTGNRVELSIGCVHGALVDLPGVGTWRGRTLQSSLVW